MSLNKKQQLRLLIATSLQLDKKNKLELLRNLDSMPEELMERLIKEFQKSKEQTAEKIADYIKKKPQEALKILQGFKSIQRIAVTLKSRCQLKK